MDSANSREKGKKRSLGQSICWTGRVPQQPFASGVQRGNGQQPGWGGGTCKEHACALLEPGQARATRTDELEAVKPEFPGKPQERSFQKASEPANAQPFRV